MTGGPLTADEVIRAGGCLAGIRTWFAAREGALPEGLTFRSFIQQGMPLDVAVALDDPFINRVLAARGGD